MSHRSEHETWMRRIALDESSPEDLAVWTQELSRCAVCEKSFSAMNRLQQSLEISGMERRFEDAALAKVLAQKSSLSEKNSGGIVRALRPAMAIAAVLLLGAVALFFMQDRKAGNGDPLVLGGEIRIQRLSAVEFSWNAGGCEEFDIAILDAQGREVHAAKQVSATRFSLSAGLAAALDPGKEYEIRVSGKNPRPNAENPTASLRFSYP